MRFTNGVSSMLALVSCLAAIQTTRVNGEGRLRSSRKSNDSIQASKIHDVRKLQGITLTLKGNEGGPAFPLGACEGDCDNDGDCQGSLKCYQRGKDDKEVPGCLGAPEGAWDYCYEDPTYSGSNTMGSIGGLPELFTRDENAVSISTAKLTLCEGDCDHNGECEGSLRCFQRGNTEPVPGCLGEGETGMDYCFDPNAFAPVTSPPTNPPTPLPSAPPTPPPTASSTPPPSVPPTPPPSLAPTPPPSPIPTPVPTTRVTLAPTAAFQGASGQQLNLIGNNLPYKLQACEGDCDDDIDCEGDLKCYQRGTDDKEVPGCLGAPKGAWDYCYDDSVTGSATSPPALATTLPPTPSPTSNPTAPVTSPPTRSPTPLPSAPPTPPPTVSSTPPPSVPPTPPPSLAPTAAFYGNTFGKQLNLIGNNVGYELGACEGDCDNDNDCKGDLKCYQRGTDNQEVPGCLGVPEGSWDYCYDDRVTGSVISPTTPATTPSPTLSPTPSPTPSPTSSPTVSPATGVLVFMGNNGKPSSAFPLKMCQSDCDSDGECEGSLLCFQRDEDDTEPILGCTGILDANKDYCYDPNFGSFGASSTSPPGSNTLAIVGNDGSPSSAFPLKICQADCDSDSECEGTLTCFQRDDEVVPGCSGTAARGRDYCIDEFGDFSGSLSTPEPTPAAPTWYPSPLPTPSPTSLPTVSPTPQRADTSNVVIIVGNNGDPSSAFPLLKCQGDCDDDKECKGNLECFQRGNTEPVPGCIGSGDAGRDYCYDPADDGGSERLRSFKLKLFWEEGYFWQESSKESEWCMTCGDGSCKNPDDTMMVKKCDKIDTKWEFLEPGGNGTVIKMEGKDLCLARVNVRALRTAVCDYTSIRQRWHAGAGSFEDVRFELKPLDKFGCVSQHHHPKSDEVVYVETCAKAHRAETGFWELYT